MSGPATAGSGRLCLLGLGRLRRKQKSRGRPSAAAAAATTASEFSANTATWSPVGRAAAWVSERTSGQYHRRSQRLQHAEKCTCNDDASEKSSAPPLTRFIGGLAAGDVQLNVHARAVAAGMQLPHSRDGGQEGAVAVQAGAAGGQAVDLQGRGGRGSEKACPVCVLSAGS